MLVMAELPDLHGKGVQMEVRLYLLAFAMECGATPNLRGMLRYIHR